MSSRPEPASFPLDPPDLVFGQGGSSWRFERGNRVVCPDGRVGTVVEARVLAGLARVVFRPASGGPVRSLLFHRLNTPAMAFRQLKSRLRWGLAVQRNFPRQPRSHPLTHGASGGVNGGTGLANPHDR